MHKTRLSSYVTAFTGQDVVLELIAKYCNMTLKEHIQKWPYMCVEFHNEMISTHSFYYYKVHQTCISLHQGRKP